MQTATTSNIEISPIALVPLQSNTVLEELRRLLQTHLEVAEEAPLNPEIFDDAQQAADFAGMFRQQIELVGRLHHALALLHGDLLGSNASPSIGAMACAASALAMADAPSGFVARDLEA